MKVKKLFYGGIGLIAMFALWTFLIQTVDVQYVGQKGTAVGFASLNRWFHEWTGIHKTLYTVTDWLGSVPIFFCTCFGGIGLVQLIQRKSLFRVDSDILILGVYYVIVILGYLIFEMFPINYRPIPINGVLEASYPSSTTLLVLSVMPTVAFQSKRRIKNSIIRKIIAVFAVLFSLFTVIGRTLSGVHWLTDIVGAILFSGGLYLLYVSSVLFFNQKMKG